MRTVQDTFFDERYFAPAIHWGDTNRFTLALSALTIYDSFIHSGTIFDFLRKRFSEAPPAKGGDEKTWITEYVDVRHEWLATHPRPVLRGTVYRTQCLKDQIARGNWDLSQLPIIANGIEVFGAEPA